MAEQELTSILAALTEVQADVQMLFYGFGSYFLLSSSQ